MPLPFAAIAAGLSAAKVIAGLFALDDADKLPKEMQDAYNLLQEQASEGLPADVEAGMRTKGTRSIMGAATGRQSATAFAHASRGTGFSSGADAALDRVTQMAFEEIGNLEQEIGLLDEKTRQAGVMGLAGMAPGISAYKEAKSSGATELITSGALGLLSQDVLSGLNITEAAEDPLDKILKALEGKEFNINQPNSVSNDYFDLILQQIG